MSVLFQYLNCCLHPQEPKVKEIDIIDMNPDKGQTNQTLNINLNNSYKKTNSPLLNKNDNSDKINLIKINKETDNTQIIRNPRIHATNIISRNYELKKDSSNLLSVNKNSICNSNSINEENNLNLNDSTCEGGSRKKIILTGDLFYGEEITMTPFGLKNSLFKKKEVFFGIKGGIDSQGNSNNDFIMNFNSTQVTSVYSKDESGRVFKLYFNKNRNNYILNLVHSNLVLYYFIDNIFYFDYERDYYFFLGDVFLSVSIIKKGGKQNSVNIKVMEGPHKTEKYKYEKDQMPIKIGRCGCDINIDHVVISKYHSFIDYSIEEEKFFYQDKKSTNGTTLLIKEGDSLPIRGIMNFKLEDQRFIVRESD